MKNILTTIVSNTLLPINGRGWGWVFLLLTGGLHLHAQNHDVEYNCFITAEMDARLDGNDAGSYGITQLDIIKGSNTFYLGGSLLATQPFDWSFWAYTEHSITSKTDLLFASYYDSSPFAPSKWYAGAGIHQQIGRTTLCMHYVWRQFYDEAPSNTLDATLHLPLSTKINLQPTLRFVKQGHSSRIVGLIRMRIEFE